MAYISRLEVVVEKLKEDCFSMLPGIMKYAASKPTEMTFALVNELIPVSHWLVTSGGEQGYKIFSQDVIGVLKDLIFTGDHEVSARSRACMGKIANLMTEEDRSFIILPVCLNLIHDDNDKVNKVSGLKLLGQLTPLFTKELVENLITSELVSLSQDQDIKVKMESITQMANTGGHIDQAVIAARFLPEIRRLCADSNWEVRKSFIDNCVIITGYMPLEIRSGDIATIVTTLLGDKSRWVKESALKHLGKILSLMSKKFKSDSLFAQYIKIPKTIKKMGKASQVSICIACAQAIPGVIEAFGPESWKKIKELYLSLMKQDPRVQAELAKGIHQLGSQLKKSDVQSDVIGIVGMFLQSKNSFVRQEAITHLATFLEVLDPDKRETLADVYAGIQSETNKWRVREILAKQINTLSKLFSNQTFIMIILPLILNLCRDKVASVREHACQQFYHIIRNKKDDEHCLLLIVEQMKSFADFKRFTWRQTFIYMCENVMEMDDIFRTNFLTLFCNLADDRVVNVRISIAKVIRKHIFRNTPVIKTPELQRVIEKLKTDPCIDVRRGIYGVDYNEEEDRKRMEQSFNLKHVSHQSTHFDIEEKSKTEESPILEKGEILKLEESKPLEEHPTISRLSDEPVANEVLSNEEEIEAIEESTDIGKTVGEESEALEKANIDEEPVIKVPVIEEHSISQSTETIQEQQSPLIVDEQKIKEESQTGTEIPEIQEDPQVEIKEQEIKGDSPVVEVPQPVEEYQVIEESEVVEEFSAINEPVEVEDCKEIADESLIDESTTITKQQSQVDDVSSEV